MPNKLWGMGIDARTNRIWIMLDGFDPEVNAALKANLPGPPRFSEGCWRFPLHWDTCIGARKVADRFGAKLQMDHALTEWGHAEKARQATIPDVKSMELVPLAAVEAANATMWAAMASRPFQTVGAAFAARNRACLIADEPGLGKTLQTIGAVVESGITGPILVVAPKAAAQLTWPQELAKWLPTDDVTVVGTNLSAAGRVAAIDRAMNMLETEEWIDRHWIITSPNYIRIRADTDQYNNYIYQAGKKVLRPVREAVMELFGIEWAAVVVDESHQTLAGCTGNKKKQSAQRLGLGALNIREKGLRLALSGTPFRGKESYLWGQLNWLRPDKYRSYRKWLEIHFETWFNGFGWETGSVKDRAAMYAEAADVMIRRTKAEVAKDLPAKDYHTVWLDMEPKQAKAYQSMVKEAQAELEGGILMTTGILAELTRLKQFAGSYGKMDGDDFVPSLPSNKFDWLYEWIDERGIPAAGSTDIVTAELPKVVVASQFKQLLDVFADGLADKGIKAHKFTGDTPDAKREAIKDDWQNNADSDTRVMLLTTTAGGVSLTLDAADDMVILDETWNPDDQKQVEDRLHRLSRIHQVTIWKVFSRNTIEESIASDNLADAKSLEQIMDIERAKALILK